MATVSGAADFQWDVSHSTLYNEMQALSGLSTEWALFQLTTLRGGGVWHSCPTDKPTSSEPVTLPWLLVCNDERVS